MKLKKLLCAMLSAAMVVSLTACGSGDSTSKQKSPKRRQPKKRQMLQVKQQIQRKKMDLQPH